MKKEAPYKGNIVGLRIRVVESNNKDNLPLHGQVVDETRNTLFVECPDGSRKRLMKDQCTFALVLLSGKEIIISGSRLVGRPEERIKV